MRFQEVKQPTINTPTTLPARQTPGSAGHDFYLKENVLIMPRETVFVHTDVKCALEPYEVLYIHVRSSIGIKRRLSLANGTGVIDSDYYGNPDNDGNIILALYNYGDSEVYLKAGERVAQGVVHEFQTEHIRYDGLWNATTRQGGIGSTNLVREADENERW